MDALVAAFVLGVFVGYHLAGLGNPAPSEVIHVYRRR